MFLSAVKLGIFKIGLYEDLLTFEASLKWLFKELHFQSHGHWLHCSGLRLVHEIVNTLLCMI